MFRHWALGWLRDDLMAYAKLAEQNNLAMKQAIQQRLAHWRRDPDLASVRDRQALDRLGDNERAAWQALWRDVDELEERLAKKDEPTTGRKQPETPTIKPESRRLRKASLIRAGSIRRSAPWPRPSPEGGQGIVVAVVESASVASQERPGVGRRSYERASQAPVGDTRSAISGPPQRRPQAAWRANPRGEAVRGALDRVPRRTEFAQVDQRTQGC